MAKAAVPQYLGSDFAGASPGLRFGMYFASWSSAREEYELDYAEWVQNGRKGREPQPPKVDEDWILPGKRKTVGLREVLTLQDEHLRQLRALRERQAALAAAGGEHGLTLEAVATAPFVTGTGMEHPLENGFAFLNPYGLPYLPGAGVKGVLRCAAQEMAGVGIECAYPNPAGWTAEDIDALFGKETASGDSETVRTRGALQFWDVLPQPAGDALGIDVMTPHYAGYYQGRATPADCESPNPIPFLVVPAGSRFVFHIACDPRRLPAATASRWRELLEAAFVHAFDWLGFGAKTSVGYGQMGEDPAAAAAREAAAERQAQEEAARREAAKPAEARAIESFRKAWTKGRDNNDRKAGGELFEAFRKVAAEAVAWAPEWRRELVPLLGEVNKWLEGDARKRRQKYLDPLQG